MRRFCLFAVIVGVASAGFGCGSSGGARSSESGPGSGGAGAAGPGSGAGRGSGAGGAGQATGGAGAGAGGSSGTGIAARYPGDVGIENDPDVIFFDDFEPYKEANDLYAKWDAIYQVEDIHFATDPADVFAGKQALEFTLPQEDAELSDGVDKVLTQERDVLFLRYYGKFQPPYDVVGSSHNGSSISAHYFVNGMATPGIPADGTNKFLVNLENWRGDAMTPSPGDLNVYVYHPEQRSMWGDHFFPTGDVSPYSPTPFDFGPDFVPRPNVIPDLDKWYCYEYMVKANTPGQRDGEVTIWLDGKLVADFGNLRFRDIASLTINRFGLSFHIYSNPNGPSKKWYDNVVAAKSYIGPMVPP